MSLLLRYWPYLAVAIALAGVGAFAAHTLDGNRYAALELQYSNYRTQATEAALKAQDVARTELEAQIKRSHETTLNNQAVLANVQNTNAAVMADRDRLRGLLASATRALARLGPVSETDDRSATASAGSPSGDGRADKLVGRAESAITECKLNASQLDGLSAQILPQL